jgi:hypothetical protein
MSSRRWRFTKLCADCQERKARFRHHDRVKADRDHVLCFQCWRADINRSRARQLALPLSPEWRPALAGPLERVGELTMRQAAHRARMLSHLCNVAGGTICPT